ncbi:hypothetical protein TNCV_4533891 [Trichonephila clavipes]|nr:hypothetical protein TNCV_4533891 [Trichonephila clavipes]
MDATPDEGEEMSRSSSTSPIPSEAENEDEIEEEEGFAQIQKALDDPAESIRNEITRIVKKAKYYTTIIDSAPDISRTEQR